MKTDILFLCYNRLAYTKLTLPALLADPSEEFSLIIWDNGSSDGTREYLASIDDPRVTRKVFARENVYLHGAINDIVDKSSADLIGIVLNDILVTPGWTRPLAQAHSDVPEFGIIGSWHFQPEDFDYELAKHKIAKFEKHQILRHPWTGVAAGLVKLKTMKEFGPLNSHRTSYYWIRMALKGYINGYYYPLIYADHLDDPRSPHSAIKTEEDFQREASLTIRSMSSINSMDDWVNWLHQDALNIQRGSYDPRQYVGWRRKLRTVKHKAVKSCKKLLSNKVNRKSDC